MACVIEENIKEICFGWFGNWACATLGYNSSEPVRKI